MAQQGPWMARVEDDWPHEGVRLLFARRFGDPSQHEYLAGDLQWVTAEDGSVRPERAGIWLPRPAWQALVEEVDPVPHSIEVRRLEEALAVERRRVDELIQSSLRERTS